ncbi:MAG: FliI/YscN family ATPase [Candidatus Schekmanbacteria bacterium]|nr:FliI/YscN family ATPase [Candidatus Schekmanbacteria bacterium]
MQQFLEALEPASPVAVRGRVTEVVGLIIKAAVPGVRMGEVCLIHNHHQKEPLRAEVVGFKDEQALLMPLGEPKGVGLDSEVVPTGKPFSIICGDAMLGRVVNGLGEAMDGGPPLFELPGMEEWAVDRPAPDPMTRKRVTKPLPMGIRALDACLTFGEGQRVGLFAGSGVGKSTLMGQIARNALSEVNVICLVGERGREVLDFIEESLGPEGMKRSVVVCATSDRPSLERSKCCFVATAIAEYFRDVKCRKVLLMMDSTTRFARAQREIGLAVGEPPARQGYPPSVFSELPRLLERTGNSDKGSITALYTVLVAGGDMEEPIADEVRGILDGHIILDRALGARNHWPAISVPPSLSRVMSGIVSDKHKKANAKIREVLATYDKQRDLILLGAYQKGSDPKTDWAIAKIEAVEKFLRQGGYEKVTFQQVVDGACALFRGDPDWKE